jgi:aconitate hydratase
MTGMRKAVDDELDLQGRKSKDERTKVAGSSYDLGHGDVVIAAITSCTNTSNPAVCWQQDSLRRRRSRSD